METCPVWLTSVPEELNENMPTRSGTAMENSQLIHSFPNVMISGVQYSNSSTTHTDILGGTKRRDWGAVFTLYLCFVKPPRLETLWYIGKKILWSKFSALQMGVPSVIKASQQLPNNPVAGRLLWVSMGKLSRNWTFICNNLPIN